MKTDRHVVELVGKIAYSGAVDALIVRLADWSDPVCACAFEALGRIGGEKAVNALIELLPRGEGPYEEEEEEERQWMAFLALGQIGGAMAVDALGERLSYESTAIRMDAAMALVQIGDTKAVAILRERLSDEDTVGRWAAEKLGLMPSRLPHSDEEGDLGRAVATEAQCRIGDTKDADVFIEQLLDDDCHFRWVAALELGRIGGAKALTRIIARVKDRYCLLAVRQIAERIKVSAPVDSAPEGVRVWVRKVNDSLAAIVKDFETPGSSSQ